MILLGGVVSIGTFGIAPGPAAAVDQVSPVPLVSGFSTPSGGGFRLAYADGRVFGTGFTRDEGDPEEWDQPLNGPLVGGVSTLSGRGYWLASSDGGVFSALLH